KETTAPVAVPQARTAGMERGARGSACRDLATRWTCGRAGVRRRRKRRKMSRRRRRKSSSTRSIGGGDGGSRREREREREREAHSSIGEEEDSVDRADANQWRAHALVEAEKLNSTVRCPR